VTGSVIDPPPPCLGAVGTACLWRLDVVVGLLMRQSGAVCKAASGWKSLQWGGCGEVGIV
jgi:hypothetical protein